MPRTPYLYALVAALVTAACAGHASAANPILGHWRLSSWIPNTNPNWLAPVCSITEIVFTPKSTTAFDPKINSPVAVTYNIQPRRVVVSSVNDVIYTLVDADHIQRDDPGKCTYRRVR